MLVKRFKDIEIDSVFSSPFKRTIDTVFPIASICGLEVKISDDLRERENGIWLEDFDSYAIKQWKDHNYKLKNGESLKEVQIRNIRVLNRILENSKEQSIIIGTHGTSLSTIINYFNPNYSYTDYRRIQDRMPYVLKMEFDGLKFISYSEIDF